jgi:hypothetical protein
MPDEVSPDFSPENLAKLPLEQLMRMRPSITPGAHIDECRRANAEATNLIRAIRAKKAQKENLATARNVPPPPPKAK